MNEMHDGSTGTGVIVIMALAERVADGTWAASAFFGHAFYFIAE